MCLRPSEADSRFLAQLLHLQKGMKTFSRIGLLGITLLTLCFTAEAKSDALTEFITRVSQSCVSFDYSYTLKKDRTNLNGSGSVKVQGDSFLLKGDGLEVWCDGKTRWVIDRVAEEAVIEPVDLSETDFAANPALLLTVVDKAFDEVSDATSKFGDKVADVSILSPREEVLGHTEITQFKMFFKSGTSELLGAELKLNDGSVSTFTLRNLIFSDQKEAPFRFDEKTLDDSYIITDLR
jgi:hypothetical protein